MVVIGRKVDTYLCPVRPLTPGGCFGGVWQEVKSEAMAVNEADYTTRIMHG